MENPYIKKDKKLLRDNQADVVEARRDIDWCLHTMALISPAADRDPEMAKKVNTRATQYIVEAIEKRDPAHIKLVYIGSVAEYGDRLPFPLDGSKSHLPSAQEIG